MEKKHVKILVFGMVHGVFFRDTTRRVAKNKNLTGYVKNMRDGSVYIEAEGPEDKLKELLAFSKKGPEHARVKRVEFEYSEPQHEFSGFEYQF